MSSLNNWLGALFFLCSIDGFYEPWGTNQPQHTKTQKTSNIRSFEEIGCWKTAATNSKCGTVDGRNPAPPGTYKNLNCIERDMIEKKLFLTKSLTLRQTSMWREGTTTNSCFFCNRQRYPPPPQKKKTDHILNLSPPPKKKQQNTQHFPVIPAYHAMQTLDMVQTQSNFEILFRSSIFAAPPEQMSNFSIFCNSELPYW